ncbi:hypothetical protein ACH5RR_030343 [Cinchona calisaya]|uniref:DNA-directed RNA polymerase n=1 Tax=Cinchona calisaya TaxID=153742 RepID=A0ABD2YUB9_9GENT
MERVSGMVATLRRTNPLQTTAAMRKTRQQVSYIGRVGDARYLTKVLEPFLDKFLDCGLKQLADDTSSLIHGYHKIFLDGDWIGTSKDSALFVAELRSQRRNKEIPQQVEIKRDEKHGEIHVFSDAGRVLRPSMVENLKRIKALKGGDYSFQSLLENGIIELIGPEEEEDCAIAWGIGHLFTGTKENPPMKDLYQSEKHSQQAIGFSTTNLNVRVDANTQQLYYLQRPLFRTMLSDCLGKPTYPRHKGMLPRPEYSNGQCAIGAVNVHLGYNQEDSLVMNRASLERGMFRSEHTRSYKSDEKENLGKKLKSEDYVKFGKTPSKIGCVDSLDDDGFPLIGASLQIGDTVIRIKF